MAPRLHTVRKRDVRLAASLILLAASLVLLVWGFWPERRTVQVLRLDAPATADAASAQPVRAVRLVYPDRIRLNDRAVVRLAFEVGPQGVATTPIPETARSTAADAVNPIAEARLEMPGALVRPPDSIHEALVPDRSLEFTWTVVISAPGEYRGTAWSFLTIQDESSAHSSRIALGAQDVPIRSISLLGMGGEAARIVGCLSLIGGLVLGLPFIEPAARWTSKRGKTGSVI